MHYRINNNLTFIHVPKTGGTSIGYWIEKNCKNYRQMYKNNENQLEVHTDFFYMIEEYKDNCIAVTRNPYDRLVSYYYHYGNNILSLMNDLPNDYKYKYKDENIFNKQFEEWNKGFKNFVFNCKYVVWRSKELDQIDKMLDHKQWAANPQVKYLGKNLKNFTILKFENLTHDFQKMQNLVNCNLPLPKKNVNNDKLLKRGPWEDYYDNDTKKEVYRIWQDDFELLGYKP